MLQIRGRDGAAKRQQSFLFVSQLKNDRLVFRRNANGRPLPDGLHGRLDPTIPAQTDDQFRPLDPADSEFFEDGKPALLFGIIQRHVEQDPLKPLHTQPGHTIRLEIGVFAGDNESPDAR